MKHLTTLAVIAQNFIPLLRGDRKAIYDVRFEGTNKHLTAWATDGHVMGRLVVLGSFAAPRATMKIRATGASVMQSADLGPDAIEFHPTRKLEIDTENYERVIPASRAPCGGPGLFMGPALRTMAEVVCRFGAQVQFAAPESPKEAMRVDSLPFHLTTLDEHVAWLTFAVMPSSVHGTGARTVVSR